MSSRAALAATRSLDILNYLAANPGQGFSLTELARALDVNPSSMFAIVNAMTTAGYLSRHPFQKTYRLGVVAAAVGQAALHQDPMLEAASEEVQHLGAELEVETVVVAASEGDMVTVARAGLPAGRFLSFIGQRVSHAAPVGSIFAAWADEEAIEAWLDRADPPLSEASRRNYRNVLDVVRHEGEAIVTLVERSWHFAASPATVTSSRRNELLVPLSPGSQHRIYYVGVPIFGVKGDVPLGLFANGTSARLGVKRVQQISERLHDAAAGIMSRVGAKVPPQPATTKRPRAASK